jgi:hypothetical protein
VKIRGVEFNVILAEEDEGGYSTQCVQLLAAISQGEIAKKHLPTSKSHRSYLEAFPE